MFAAYRNVWVSPAARNILALGMALRMPHLGATLLMTVHVVDLTGSYGLGGVVTTVWTLASTVANVLRGRLLDRLGLRRTCMVPLIGLPLAWLSVPFLDFGPLVIVAALLGLLQVPISSVVRSALAANLPPEHHRGGFALDSVSTEMSFVLGPAIAVTLGTVFDTGWTLTGMGMASVTAIGVLMWLNPSLHTGDGDAATHGWFTRRVMGVLLVTFATLLLLGASDVTIVAATRAMRAEHWLAVVMVFWGGGSVCGGVLYGMLPRPIHPGLILAGLATMFAISSVSATVPWLCALLFIAGLLCAPTLTSTVETLSSLTPASVRGTMFGLHSALITAGVAVGAPAAGIVVDAGGWRFAVVVLSGITLLLAGVGAMLLRRPRIGSA